MKTERRTFLKGMIAALVVPKDSKGKEEEKYKFLDYNYIDKECKQCADFKKCINNPYRKCSKTEPIKYVENPPEEPEVSKKNGPPDHAPAHGYRAKHTYRYYPNESTYYDAKRKLYFFMEKGGWTFGATLPSSISLSTEYVTISVNTDRPYEYYEEHEKKYPPGKSKKEKKKKGNKWAKN